MSEISTGKIVVGLGSGRSGTASLSALIDKQVGGLCFHEMNPSGAVFTGNSQAQLNNIREFQQILTGGSPRQLSIDYSRPASVARYEQLQAMNEIQLLGDIAYYYLHYVEEILSQNPNCKFVCIKRDREQTVASWQKKSSLKRWRSLWIADRLKAWITRTPFLTEYNYWQEHDGTVWMKDPVWDSCFPKFEAPSKEQAIRMYWDYYYQEAQRLEDNFPDNFRQFDIKALSSREGQESILNFIGLTPQQMVASDSVHLHKST